LVSEECAVDVHSKQDKQKEWQMYMKTWLSHQNTSLARSVADGVEASLPIAARTAYKLAKE